MKVMHVISGLSAGGAENMLLRIIGCGQTYDPDTHHIVVSLKDEGTVGLKMRENGIALYVLNINSVSRLFSGVWELNKIMRAERPDAIMSWLYHADLFALFASLLAGMGVKRLTWNLRCAYIDFKRYRWATRATVKILSLLSPLPACVAHNSPAGRTVHEELGYRPKEWAYLPNGFDDTVWYPDESIHHAKRQELDVEDGVFLVTMVARNDPAKDYETYFKAAREVISSRPESVFLCVGKDTDKLIVPPDLAQNIRILGERHDVPSILNVSDLFVLCSAFGEGFPNVVGEAMLAGLPCVVTGVWEAEALLQDTGAIVPPARSDALSDAIIKISALPEDVRREKGEKARKLIQAGYGIRTSYEKYKALWSCLSNK